MGKHNIPITPERIALDVHIGIRQLVHRDTPYIILTEMARAIMAVQQQLYTAYIRKGGDDTAEREALSANSLRINYIKSRFSDLRWLWQDDAEFLGSPEGLALKWRDYHIMHPVVLNTFDAGYVPRSYETLLFELPKVAEDGVRVAYVRSPDNAQRDLWTVTTAGKYLRRHFDMPDHAIRDVVALWEAKSDCSMYFLPKSSDAYVDAVLRGPQSCMRWHPDSNKALHPYQCYDPELGWRMAVRVKNDKIVGRGLVYDHPDCGSVVVRTFKAAYDDPDEGGYSHADEQLQSWLTTTQGVTKVGEYPDGTLLRYIPHRHNDAFLAPYIDGNTQNVDIDEARGVLVIDSCGSFCCNETDGWVHTSENTCSCCGENFPDDECGSREIGYDNYELVCDGCLDNNYVYVYGRRGRQYYVNSDYAVYVDGEHYDEDYLGDNDIYSIECGSREGDYAHADDIVTDHEGYVWHVRDIGDEVLYITAGDSEDEYARTDECTVDDEGNVWLIPEYEAHMAEQEDEETTDTQQGEQS